MNLPTFPAETVLTTGLRLLWRASGRSPRLDHLFTHALHHRRDYLPRHAPGTVIPDFDLTEVRLTKLPLGRWSAPLMDVVLLLKCAMGFRSQRILELGSFRGETARLLAENTPPETTVCAVDIDERHGAAYAGREVEKRIRRVTGRIEPGLFAPGESFDLIFLDAAHDFASVVADSNLALGWLAPEGVMLWHDYYNGGNYFGGGDNVAEALKICAQEHPIVALEGSILAIHSRHPGWETARLITAARDATDGGVMDREPWRDQTLRG